MPNAPDRPDERRITGGHGVRRHHGRWRAMHAAVPLLLAGFGLAGLGLAGCRPPDPAPTGPARQAQNRTDGAGPALGQGRVLDVRVVHVQDGDSIVARDRAGRSLTIRLSGIDAPERSQPHADASRRHLAALLHGADVEVRTVKTDAYDRLVAQVRVDQRGALRDVGLAQVEAGMAWYFRRYAGDLPRDDRGRYAAAEAAARNGGLGLWASASPEPPWAFRQRGGGRR